MLDISKIQNNFDYDCGNGIYDVVTQEDHERWVDQKRKGCDHHQFLLELIAIENQKKSDTQPIVCW